MLACGAYESNPAMAQAYEGLPGFLSMFPPTIDGDGMIMGAELGAQIRTIRNNLAVFLGFNIPGKHPGEEPLFRIVGISEMFCPHTIVVNRDGARFADETYFQNMVPSLRHYDVKKHRHANLPCYLDLRSAIHRRLLLHRRAARQRGAALGIARELDRGTGRQAQDRRGGACNHRRPLQRLRAQRR